MKAKLCLLTAPFAFLATIGLLGTVEYSTECNAPVSVATVVAVVIIDVLWLALRCRCNAGSLNGAARSLEKSMFNIIK